MHILRSGKITAWILLALLLSWGGISAQNPTPSEWNITPLNSSIPGKPSLYRLNQPDGTEIWVASDTTIPMVTLVAAYPKGTLHQTQLGTAHLWAMTLPYHNPAFNTPQEAEQWLKRQGWLVETHLRAEYLLLRMRVPKADWRAAIQYLLQIENETPYTQNEVDFAKQMALQQIQTAEMDPWVNFQQEIENAVCSESNMGILNRVGNYAQIRRLEAAQLDSFSQGTAMCGCWIGGDISPDSLIKISLPQPTTVQMAPMTKAYIQEKRDGYWIREENNWASQTVLEYVYQLREHESKYQEPTLEKAYEIIPVALSIPGNELYDTLIGKGMALDLQWRYEPGLKTATWRFTVVPKPGQAYECTKTIFQIMEKGLTLTPEAWSNALKIIRLRGAIARTKTSNWLLDWATREMTEKDYSPEKHPKELEKLDLEAVQEWMGQLLGPFSDARGVLYRSREVQQLYDPDPMVYGESKGIQLNYNNQSNFNPIQLEGSKVYFKANKPEPDEASMQRIEKLAEWLKRSPEIKIYVNGYTDGIGDGVKNYHLSIDRADLVMRILSEGFGIDPARMTVRGYGEAFPDYPDDTPEHRALNRRVTFTINQDAE